MGHLLPVFVVQPIFARTDHYDSVVFVKLQTNYQVISKRTWVPLLKEDWDSNTQRIRPGARNAVRYNEHLNRIYCQMLCQHFNMDCMELPLGVKARLNRYIDLQRN